MEAAERERPSFAQAVRRDPGHFSELAVLYSVPYLLRAVERTTDAGEVERRSQRLVHKAVGRARLDGAVCGTSFYFGLPATLAALYWNQLLVVLRIAALYGHDPADPLRAAEILVFQGHHKDRAAAATALAAANAGAVHGPRPPSLTVLKHSLARLPGLLGLQLRDLRHKNPIDAVLSVAQIVGYLIPVVSIPTSATSSARATKRLTHAAVDYYSKPGAAPEAVAEFVFPPPPSPRHRHRLRAKLVAGGVVPGLLIAIFAHGSHVLLVALIELFLLLTVGRLLWVTRDESRPRWRTTSE